MKSLCDGQEMNVKIMLTYANEMNVSEQIIVSQTSGLSISAMKGSSLTLSSHISMKTEDFSG